MALCNVLQFFVNTGDKRLSSIIVKGERIFQQDEGNKQFQASKLRLKVFSMLGMLASIMCRGTKQPVNENPNLPGGEGCYWKQFIRFSNGRVVSEKGLNVNYFK